MRIFIVHAHHEPTSFNAAMTGTAVQALRAAGHEVRVSDLYAMNFDPVSDRRNFLTVKDPLRLKQQDEEAHANAHDGFVPELEAEMAKLAWCEVLVLQFPLWWLGMPAIMKGWIDRVFAVGRSYGGGRYFDKGVFKGKRAMCAVTVGGEAAAYSDIGIYGPMQAVLHPIQHGILAFVGFSVVEPYVVHAPARLDAAQRAAVLDTYAQRLLCVATAPTLPMVATGDYAQMVMTSEARLRRGLAISGQSSEGRSAA